ncbi:hypothetical protein FGO68_gene9577 [Halteria grandinella]|uniref:Uncharacterized protein n=1 Tax=Halteria grandinella TaxID=5974 RepID=A0A8J8NH42_HALGN|nr:hypothetical protein FGO68_gene9577 [Halteria grandinella]
MQDDENFIIIETQIVKKQWAHILYHAKIKDVEAIIDRGEPRKLNVNIKIQSLQSMKVSYLLFRNLIKMCSCYLMIVHILQELKDTLMI